jgi:hypothetical protein
MMKKFEKGDRVFDPRSGWGDLIELNDNGDHCVKFDSHNFKSYYSFLAAIKILSYTEYAVFDESEFEDSWNAIYTEWCSHDSNLKYREYLEQNFEPPIRKCK